MEDTPSEIPGGLSKILRSMKREQKQPKPLDIPPQKIFEGFPKRGGVPKGGRSKRVS